VPYRRIRGAAESEDPRRVLWSKYALTDKSVDAAMMKRADMAMSDPDKYEKFLKYYNKLSEDRQEEFDNYYDKTLTRLADRDEEAEFKLIQKSGIQGERDDNSPPPYQRLERWARNRYEGYPYEKDADGNPVLDKYDNKIYPKQTKYWDWMEAQKAQQDSTKWANQNRAWEHYRNQEKIWAERKARKSSVKK